MTDPNEYNFVPQTNPPADRAATAYWFAFQDQKMIVRTTGKTEAVPLLSDLASFDLNPIRWQYLGYLENGRAQPIHCYSAEIDPSVVLTDGLIAEGLRDLYAPLGDTLFNLAGRAVQIVNWDRTHQYCGQCGAPTETLTLERSRRCPACGLTSYPRISPAIIIAASVWLPALWSRANRWKSARGARCLKRWGCTSKTSTISRASLGRFLTR